MLATTPAMGRPLGVWEQVQASLETWLRPTFSPTSGPTAMAAAREVSQPPMYARASEAVIEILVDDHLNGTGFLVSPGGYAMTAAHVVQSPGRRIEARTQRGRVAAEVVALDLGHDLGLIKLVTADRTPWPTLDLAEAMPPAASQVFLMGTPLYRHKVLFSGMVARDGLTFEYLPEEQRYIRIMHLSGLSPPGTSGGPWMLPNGDVVGVQSGLMHSRGTHVGVAYMAPVEAIRSLLHRAEDARTASLGVAIEELWEQPDHYLRRFPGGTEGVMISQIVPGGPAEDVGLRPEDLITGVDGRRIALRDELLGYIRSRAPGEAIFLTVIHPGELARTVRVRLDWLERRPLP
ncbi:MAG: serine protease [Myxococcales bacterium]|nr:serine protease [Myxococcales bacterium]